MSYIGTATNESPVIVLTAAAEISGAFLAVQFTKDGVSLAESGGAAIGITTAEQETALEGDRVNVQIKDICRWTSGAEISAGDLLSSDGNGKCVKATGGDFIIGMALEAANSADIPISVQITKSGYAAAGKGE